ncbi:MAG: hypothetical protein LIO37_04395 [Clostridiales bacterium]|nr:hypothetical protein [Clostridiales bacterium]
MFGFLRRLNDALPGLVVGILFYGILLELVGVWFVDDKAAYSIGLWYGIAIAVGMAVNMATVIFDSTFEDTDGRTNYRVVAKSLLRYVVVVILFAVLAVFRFGYVIAAFLGVMGLKASAYMQPIFQKIEIKMGWREPDPEIDTEQQGDIQVTGR